MHLMTNHSPLVDSPQLQLEAQEPEVALKASGSPLEDALACLLGMWIFQGLTTGMKQPHELGKYFFWFAIGLLLVMI